MINAHARTQTRHMFVVCFRLWDENGQCSEWSTIIVNLTRVVTVIKLSYQSTVSLSACASDAKRYKLVNRAPEGGTM